MSEDHDRMPDSLPDCVDIEDVTDAVASGEYIGFCLECGNQQDGCEPDACEYTCAECDMPSVYGAQELLIRYG